MSNVLPRSLQQLTLPGDARGVPHAKTLIPRFALSVALGVGVLWGWMAVQGPPGGYGPPGQQPPNPFSNQPPPPPGAPANPFANPPPPPQPAPQPRYQPPARTGGGGGGTSICGTFCAACAGEMCGEAVCCGCESALSICTSATPLTLATAPGMLWRTTKLLARPEALGAMGALLVPLLILAGWRRREAALEG